NGAADLVVGGAGFSRGRRLMRDNLLLVRGPWPFREHRRKGYGPFHAKVAELADAPDLGSGSRKALGVRLPPFAYHQALSYQPSAFTNACHTAQQPRLIG